MRPSLVIFDLDGTLIDSFPWFLRNLNDVADTFGFRRVADHEVEPLRHAGTREILASLDVPLWKLPRIARHMRRMKADHIAEIPPFPGVEPMLRALRDLGMTLAVVTSDHESNARAELRACAALFSHLACGAAIFGKAAKFRAVLRRAGVPPAQALAIGDEVRDIEAARAAGIPCAAVTWGYAAPAALRAMQPDMVFERVEEIAERLGS